MPESQPGHGPAPNPQSRRVLLLCSSPEQVEKVVKALRCHDVPARAVQLHEDNGVVFHAPRHLDSPEDRDDVPSRTVGSVSVASLSHPGAEGDAAGEHAVPETMKAVRALRHDHVLLVLPEATDADALNACNRILDAVDGDDVLHDGWIDGNGHPRSDMHDIRAMREIVLKPVERLELVTMPVEDLPMRGYDHRAQNQAYNQRRRRR